MTNNPIKIILKSGKDQSVRRKHPWIFSGAIKKTIGNPNDGDIVEVYDNKDEFLAKGHYQNASIAVRILSFENIEIDQNYWDQAILAAFNSRKLLGYIDSEKTNVYRLVYAEGDHLPGLIIDCYANHFVIQLHSTGMYKALNNISEALKNVYGEKIISIFNKSKGTLPFKDDSPKDNHFLKGSETSDVVNENGLQFKVEWVDGQKTGFFIDQRENRSLLEKYSKGRTVLNMFCYTGGFSVYALRGKAKLVHSVDSSAKAIDLVQENVKLNFHEAPHEAFATDAFSYFDQANCPYDLIILDPPAFAKHQKVLSNALIGYKRLNQRALEKINKGGILFTYSCSQVVSKDNFRKSVFAAAANANRKVRILHQLSQPTDHPINIFHPEGEYLKGLVLLVE